MAAKTVQQGNKQWESPQVEPAQLSTEVVGGDAPSKEDVVKSANARAQRRHDMKKEAIADVGVLADSGRMKNNEMVGIKDNGYIVKKNLPYGVNAHYNSLPPGMDIEDQEITDIRTMGMRAYKGGLGYPGDGWADDPNGGELDMGRPGTTNYNYSGST